MIDCDASAAIQKNQLESWFQKILQTFVKKHGAFKVDSSNNLSDSDFTHIYDLIESVSRFELLGLRNTNEKKRLQLFKLAFDKVSTDKLKKAREDYITQIYADINQEIGLYKRV